MEVEVEVVRLPIGQSFPVDMWASWAGGGAAVGSYGAG